MARGRGGNFVSGGRGASNGAGRGAGGRGGRGSARGGGGGRGRGRGRGHASINSAMMELAGSDMSVGSYLAAAAVQPSSNPTASRAFFPPLAEGVAQVAEPLNPTEEIYCTVMNMSGGPESSPCYIRLGSSSSSVRGGHERTHVPSSYAGSHVTGTNSIWDKKNPAVVAKLLPDEIRHDRVARKRRRNGLVDDFTPLFPSAEDSDEDEEGEEDDADKDGEQNPGADGDKALEEEEDAELEADYRTGARFDDDDGYISQDSGDDAPVF